MTSQSNTSKALSDISKQPNTRSCSRKTLSYEDMSSFKVTKNIWEQLSKPPKNGIIIKENLMINEHSSSSEHSNEEIPHPNIMSVIVTNMDTSEDRMVELEKLRRLKKWIMRLHLSRITLRVVMLLNQVIHILSRILTKGMKLCKKVNHKIRSQLYHCLFSSCRKWLQTPSKLNMVDLLELSLCIPSHIRRGSTIWECRMDTNHLNSNNLMEKTTQNNMLLISSKHTKLLVREKICC